MFSKAEAKKILLERQDLRDRALNIKIKVYGHNIFVRGIIEFSNYCRKNCLYCGIRKSSKVERYRMSKEDIIDRARLIYKSGIKTIVLQSGEDLFYSRDMLCDIISHIKKDMDCAITLCIGERTIDDYRAFFEAGADRFLIKHETSNPKVYEYLHPGETLSKRLKIYEELKKLGYQVGLGNIIGLPYTDIDDYINDIFLMKELDCDMAGIGPFIPTEGTPLSNCSHPDLNLVLDILALARVILKDVNIPATTALYSLGGLNAISYGLDCGCNVIMPNFTPQEKRKKYRIYDGKRPISLAEVEKVITDKGFEILDTKGGRKKYV